MDKGIVESNESGSSVAVDCGPTESDGSNVAVDCDTTDSDALVSGSSVAVEYETTESNALVSGSSVAVEYETTESNGSVNIQDTRQAQVPVCNSVLQETLNALQQINNRLISLGIDSDSVIYSFSERMKFLSREKLNIFAEKLHSIKIALDTFSSNDHSEVVMSTLSIISSITGLLPVSSEIIQELFSLTLKILDYQFEADKGAIRNKSKHILECSFNEDLKKKSSGLHRMFRDAYSYLHSAIHILERSASQITDTEIAVIYGHVPINVGSDILETLSEGAKTLSTTPKSLNDITQYEADQLIHKTFQFLNTYCCLTVFRQALLLKMYVFLVKAKASDLYLNTVKVAFERAAKCANEDLEFLKNPDPESAIIVANMDPKQRPLLCMFLENRGITQSLSKFEEGVVAFHPLKWKDWCLSRMQPTGSYYLASYALDLTYLKGVKRKPLMHERFVFEKIKDGYYIIRMIGNMKEHLRAQNESGYVIASEDDENFSNNPDYESQWKVICIRQEENEAIHNEENKSTQSQSVAETDSVYMMSTRKWPSSFAYMTWSLNGYVCCCYGNPGEQGHWIIEKLPQYQRQK